MVCAPGFAAGRTYGRSDRTRRRYDPDPRPLFESCGHLSTLREYFSSCSQSVSAPADRCSRAWASCGNHPAGSGRLSAPSAPKSPAEALRRPQGLVARTDSGSVRLPWPSSAAGRNDRSRTTGSNRVMTRARGGNRWPCQASRRMQVLPLHETGGSLRGKLHCQGRAFLLPGTKHAHGETA